MTINKNEYTYTEDIFIKKNSNFNPEYALELALKRFNDNKWKNLWDYKQLMYIYIDLCDYEKVIKLWKTALFLMNKYKVKVIWVHAILSKMVQAYLFSWNINQAEIILEKYKDVDMFFERFILEYIKWNYNYLIEKYNKIKDDKINYIWFELYLLANSYYKKWNVEQTIEIYEELFSHWKKISKENSLLETYFCYISSENLKDLYFKFWNKKRFEFYNWEFLNYKKKIDSEEIAEKVEGGIELHYNKDLMYFTINRIQFL